jgi:LSD1 subclass zinc finger protein
MARSEPNMRTIGIRLLCSTALAALLTLTASGVALAHPDAQVIADFRSAYPELFKTSGTSGAGRTAQPAAIPDIYGPGAVLNVGEIFMKVTNIGLIGNPFTNLSSDPSMQWPGSSGIEYLSFSLISVGAVNPVATDPNAIRRVSYYSEWRPPTLDPVDRMYRSYDGIVNGQRLVNDDGDSDLFTGGPLIDEDFLDGHDNDGDRLIDEDYAALGQQMFTCVMRDDTPAAINSVFNEKHIPIGLEMRQVAWAYSVEGYEQFNPVEFTIYNRSGHMLDSCFFALRTDMDCGPIVSSTYYSDDYDLPYFPSGRFQLPVSIVDPLLQLADNGQGGKDTLCPRIPIQISGTSIVDDDGDEGKTPGIGSLLLLGHTTDPLGVNAPARVQFRALRSYIVGTPYLSGGNPTVDQQRFEFMAGTDNVDQATGAVTLEQGEQVGDYQNWISVGPFRNIPDGGSFNVTIAFTVAEGSNAKALEFRTDYNRYEAGDPAMAADVLFRKYPVLANAYAAQVAFQGVYEPPRVGYEEQVPNCHGCETPMKLPRGAPSETHCEQCEGESGTVCKQVTEFATTWFNFDCDFCTGAWDENTGQGFYLRRWNAESPPPNPGGNMAGSFNYSDNPNRGLSVTPSGDNMITVAWDNLSETTADPKTRWFDFRSYRLWKAANWTRPVGSAGPNDEDWALLGEFRMFDHAPNNRIRRPDPQNPGQFIEVCPTVWIPQRAESMQVCLENGDLWDNQSGTVIHPDPTVDCIRENGQCKQDSGLALGSTNQILLKTRYPVGRYKYVDREVKNGFLYFYAITAGDSVCVEKCRDNAVCMQSYPTKGDSCIKANEFFGRVSGVESEAVTPQASTQAVGGVWVVPNPYRGYADLASRPSSWDLTPNASDPTGTHVDFMGLPTGKWKIRIYTVSGDLVAELHSDDAVNADLRPEVTGSDGQSRPGFNRQQDSANDGQARWNLISRNGQDVVSGIYLFVVESDQGQQRGRFVIIR